MTGGVSSYAALNARVRIMYSQLLAPAELATLGDAADLQSLVGALRHTPYGPAIGAQTERDFDASRIIFDVKGRLAENYQSVIRLAPGHARHILAQLYRRYEVSNLKATLRGVAMIDPHEDWTSRWDRVRPLLFPYGAATVFRAERMLESGGIAAAIETLKGTPYYETLSAALKRYDAENSLFPLEVALDLFYWRQLWQETVKLSGLDQSQATRVVGSLLDVTNLMWAIRYRTYQHLSEEEMINYTLPFGYRVRDEVIRAIAAGIDLASLVSRLYPGIPDAGTLLGDARAGLPMLEVRLKRYVMHQCEAAFVGDPFHVGIALAYLVLHDAEAQDLTLLVEAKASHLPAAEYAPFLLKNAGAHV
jgi:V/A-type H+-transporting ATPase subunit C